MKYEHKLPPQYALELLTIYAWEQGSSKPKFSTAQGFRTVLALILKHQDLCIYWKKYYDLENPTISEYLRRQLAKPRYSIRTWLRAPHKCSSDYSGGTLEM